MLEIAIIWFTSFLLNSGSTKGLLQTAISSVSIYYIGEKPNLLCQ